MKPQDINKYSILNNRNSLYVHFNDDKTIGITYFDIENSGEFDVKFFTLNFSSELFFEKIKELKDLKSCQIESPKGSIHFKLLSKSKLIITMFYNDIKYVIEEKDSEFLAWLLSIRHKRNYNRYVVTLPCSYVSTLSFGYGIIGDISEGGFRIAINSELQQDDILNVDIFLQEAGIRNCVCKVAYKGIDGSFDGSYDYVYGLKLLGISDDDMKTLKSFIGTLK